MSQLCQHWCAENDTNGNPRRLWLLFDAKTGRTVAVADEGYSGCPKAWRDVPELPEVNITNREYRDTLKWAKNAGTLMPWGG